MAIRRLTDNKDQDHMGSKHPTVVRGKAETATGSKDLMVPRLRVGVQVVAAMAGGVTVRIPPPIVFMSLCSCSVLW